MCCLTENTADYTFSKEKETRSALSYQISQNQGSKSPFFTMPLFEQFPFVPGRLVRAHAIAATVDAEAPGRSADFPVRSNSRNIERPEGSGAASELEHCCGLESPRSELVTVSRCTRRVGSAAFVLATVLALQLRAAGFSFFEPVQPPRSCQVMVHRGEAAQAPENTRPALQRCVEDGLEWAEIDLRLTQDGHYVLWHDAAFTDASGKSWKISEHSLAELRQLDVGSRFAARFAGEPMLSLADCFALCKNRLNLYLDCKAINPEQLAQEILAAGMEHQVVVYDKLEHLRRVQAASAGKVATMTKWRPGFGLPDFAVTNGLAAVEIDAPDLTQAIAKAFAGAGIKVQAKVLGAWDQPEMWERVIAAGADWLQTDLPEEVLAHALWRRVPKRPVQFSLHRGANRYAPENTLPAFAKAIRMGADYIEFDVRTTRDGAFFLLHDSRLEGKTDGSGPIDQQTSEALRKLSAGIKFGKPYASVSMPTLDEFLEAVAGKIGLYFDAKAIPPAALAEALHKYHVVERTVVYQSPQYLAKLKAIDPNIRGLPPLSRPEDVAKLAADLKPYAVDTSWDILSKELIDRCHAAGIKVFSDALGKHETIADYMKAMDWGIDLIQTDHPLRVMRAIELHLAGASPPAPVKPQASE
jgi:glycerophosphoryl diester phosphodiesterase